MSASAGYRTRGRDAPAKRKFLSDKLVDEERDFCVLRSLVDIVLDVQYKLVSAKQPSTSCSLPLQIELHTRDRLIPEGLINLVKAQVAQYTLRLRILRIGLKLGKRVGALDIQG
jgi:hypothetical protein